MWDKWRWYTWFVIEFCYPLDRRSKPQTAVGCFYNTTFGTCCVAISSSGRERHYRDISQEVYHPDPRNSVRKRLKDNSSPEVTATKGYGWDMSVSRVYHERHVDGLYTYRTHISPTAQCLNRALYSTVETNLDASSLPCLGSEGQK